MDIDIFQLKSSLLSRPQVRVGHRQLSMDYEQHSDPYSSRIRATPLIGSQNVFRRHCTASGSGHMSVVVGGCSNIRINVDSFLSRRPMNWEPPKVSRRASYVWAICRCGGRQSTNRGMPVILDLFSSIPYGSADSRYCSIRARCQNLLLLHQIGIFFKPRDKIAESLKLK
ncbi:hypothetical protein BDV09DRAFT_104600 [Aspergillus tetrazonus]